MNNPQQITIRLSKFPTHVQVSGKTWLKIGGNKIYSGTFWRNRNRAFKVLHEFIMAHLPYTKMKQARIHMLFRVPCNWEAVKRTELQGIKWTPPKNPDTYVPSWDLDNLEWPWRKALQDALVRHGNLPEDHIMHVPGSDGSDYEFVDDFDDREIVVTIRYEKA